MRRLIAACIGAALSSQTVFSATLGRERPWEARVESSYIDEVTRKSSGYEGCGVLVRGFGKTFVWTASHVSQGPRGLKLEIDGVQAAIKGRISANFGDTELIEIEPAAGVDPVAEYDREDRLFEVPGSKVLELESRAVAEGRPSPFVPGKIKRMDRHEVLPVPARVRESAEEANQPQAFEERFYETLDKDVHAHPGMSWTLAGDERITAVKLAEGTSGCASLGWYYPKLRGQGGSGKSFVYAIGGVASRTERFFEPSSLTSPEVAAWLLEQYESGRRGNIDGWEWRLRHGLHYRTNGKIVEINPLTQSVSASIPTGGGSSGDVGGGSSGDVGASRGEALTAEGVWQQYKIKPGIIEDQVPVLGYRVWLSKGGAPILLNGSLSTHAFFKERGKPFRIEPITSNRGLLNLLREKGRLPPGNLTVRSVGGAKLEMLGGRLRVTLSDRDEEGREDTIVFMLDENGVVDGRSGFDPFVTVKSERGRAYTVDLTNLFFLETANVRLGLNNTLKRDAWTSPYSKEMVEELASVPFIRFRKAGDMRVNRARDRLVRFDGAAVPITDCAECR